MKLLVNASKSAMELQKRFKETGATHLLIFHDGLKRLEDWGWGRWEPAQQAHIQKMITNLGAPVFSKNGWVLYQL